MSKKKKYIPTIRSSAAEYLSFIAASGEGGVETIYADEDVWLSQKMMGELYDIETQTVNYHLKKIFSDNELQENAVIRNFRITAKDSKNYNTKHYNLSAIIAVGYKVNSERAVQFRKWAISIIKEYTVLGNRAKESLMIDFIHQTDLDDIDDKAHIIDAFFTFTQAEQKRAINALIKAEGLNEEATKRYIRTSLKREYASENGTELNATLPKISPLNPQYKTKKQTVFEKIAVFVEKFKGVGGNV